MSTINFNSVQWAQKISATLQQLEDMSSDDLQKLGQLLTELAHLRAEGTTPSTAQMTIILQHLHTKNLDLLEAVKGGLMVHFNGGGFVFERFLVRGDGRIPNHKYESQKDNG